jgi:hypothetical protein
MRKAILILFALILVQAGCSIEEGGEAYDPVLLDTESRQRFEEYRRELLTIEDIKVGYGPIAAFGRKISADIEVRYTDGTIVYRGPMLYYSGFRGSTFIHDALKEAGVLGSQTGIWVGINGMAVNGRRRITIEPKLVTSGLLVTTGYFGKERVGVRQEKLIVDATLTASCIPQLLRFLRTGSNYFIEREIGCRDSDLPKRNPSDPIWRFYG